MKHRDNPRKFLRWYIRGLLLLSGIFTLALALFLWQVWLTLTTDYPGGSLSAVVLITGMMFAVFLCWLQVKRLMRTAMDIGKNMDLYVEKIQKGEV